jgi:hypothetical protein
MKSLPKILAAWLVAGAAMTATPAMTGCYGTEGAFIIEETPPPPRAEIVVVRPGYFWVHGRWTHPGNHWLWQPGYYERARPNAVYVEGHWEHRGHGHVWVDGGWRRRS